MTDKPAKSAVERCQHEWAWEYARMLCTKCGTERNLRDTLEHAHEALAAEKQRADEAEAALAKVLEPKPFPQCPNKQCADWARLTSKNRDGWDERARKAEAKLADADAALAELKAKLAAAEQKWLDMEDDYIQTAGKLAAAEERVRELEREIEVARFCDECQWPVQTCSTPWPCEEAWDCPGASRLTAPEPKEEE